MVSVTEWYVVNVARLAAKNKSKKSSTALASCLWAKQRLASSAPVNGDSMNGTVLCSLLRCFSASLWWGVSGMNCVGGFRHTHRVSCLRVQRRPFQQ